MDHEAMIIFASGNLDKLLDEKRTARFKDPIFVEAEIKAINYLLKFLNLALRIYYKENFSPGDIKFVKNQIKIQKKRLKKRIKQLERSNPSALKCIQKSPAFIDVYAYTLHTYINLIKEKNANGGNCNT